MKQQEFLQLIDLYGIDLNKLSIVIGELSGWEGAHGVYSKEGQWIYFSTDGWNNIDESSFESEDEAFDKMMTQVFVDLYTSHYITRSIDKDIIKIKKETVCNYLRDTYSYSERKAESAWEYLKKDMHVLFEFKYYVLNGSFIPEKQCYKVQGYSAEQIHKTTHLEVLGAFNYLVYLSTKPQEALANLKKKDCLKEIIIIKRKELKCFLHFYL